MCFYNKNRKSNTATSVSSASSFKQTLPVRPHHQRKTCNKPAIPAAKMHSSNGLPSSLPKPRVVRTTHNPAGTSVFASDEVLTPFTPFGPQASAFTIFDQRATVPVSNTDAIPSFANAIPRCPPNGVIFCISDFPGNGYAAPMHRTVSLDYGVILSGEIVLELDGGEERTVRAGEIIVQQGVNHRWINRSPEPCRMLCVMIGAEKVVLGNGTVLEETVFGKKP